MNTAVDLLRISSVDLAATLVCLLTATTVSAENIDPSGRGFQYAYAENVGWMNAEPMGDGGPGVRVGDSELSGWMWSENLGWVSLSCKNTLSCARSFYGVVNDGNGILSGYAWSENGGWIHFSPPSSGVMIDPSTGEFSGYAWGENVGWVSFTCANTASCATADYRVECAWICDPPPPAPTDTPQLILGKTGGDALLSWTAISDATGYDIVQGSLAALRSSGGDFNTAASACLDDNRTTTSLLDSSSLPGGGADWFLVRGQNCGGSATYNSGGLAQVGDRDPGMASPNSCE